VARLRRVLFDDLLLLGGVHVARLLPSVARRPGRGCSWGSYSSVADLTATARDYHGPWRDAESTGLQSRACGRGCADSVSRGRSDDRLAIGTSGPGTLGGAAMAITVRPAIEDDLPVLRANQARPDLDLVDEHFQAQTEGRLVYAVALDGDEPIGT